MPFYSFCSFASAKIKSISIYRYLSSAVVFMLLPYVRTMHQYEIQRIVRPLVLESLFRASSLRSRGARSTERKRCIPSGQEALSPLRLSI